MRVLILGGGGIVATYLVRTKPDAVDVTVACGTRVPPFTAVDKVRAVQPVDLASRRETAKLIRQWAPDVVINAAGMNSVDACEADPSRCWRMNVETTEHIVDACRDASARLLHLSTNAVYAATSRWYGAHARREPVSVYGRAKKQAEDRVAAGDASSWAIVRLSPLYGWSPPWARANPLPWMIGSLANGAPPRLCHDVYDSPLAADVAANVIWRLVMRGATGVYNVGGGEIVSRHGLGVAVARAFGFDPAAIQAVSIADLPTLAPRARWSALEDRCLERLLGYQPERLQAGLARMRRTMPGEQA